MVAYKKTRSLRSDISIDASDVGNIIVKAHSDEAEKLLDSFGRVTTENFVAFQAALATAGMVVNTRTHEAVMEQPVYDIRLIQIGADRFRAEADNDPAQAFIDAFGAITDETASKFLHLAAAAKLAVNHKIGDIPVGVKVSDWRDNWDGAARKTSEE